MNVIRELSPETRRLYLGIYTDYVEWCVQEMRIPLPAEPETIAKYLTYVAQERGIHAMWQRRSALATLHREGGYKFSTKHPKIRAVLKHPPPRCVGRARALYSTTK